MKGPFLLLLISFFSIEYHLYAQTDSIKTIRIYEYPNKALHRWAGPPFAQLEKSIGIVPSLSGFQDMYLGLGISTARFMAGEGGGEGIGTILGVEYDPENQIIRP